LLNNRYFAAAINHLHYTKENLITSKVIPLKNALYPILGKEYFFKAFGRSGFVEVQNLIPHNLFSEYMLSLRSLQKKYNVSISLSGAKFFNSPSEGICFSGKGISLSLDVPLNPTNLKFLDSLDKLNIETNSITNIAKDSRLSRHTFEKEFPSTKIFKQKITKLDPNLKFQSELSKRLSLK
jgi:decaprenylphospho-beta-D-ribofuranose 2-oxidase